MRDASFTGVAHGAGSAMILLLTGHNIVLAAHYPLISALAILLLAFGVRYGSRVTACLLFVAVLTPALIKLVLGALHAADLPAFPLALMYGRGVLGTFRHHRLRRVPSAA